MSFELTNASAIFQKVINEVLEQYLNVFVTAYFNDILIYFNDEKSHKEHVTKVLKRLKETELKMKLKKSTFHAQKVKFLKFLISHEKVRMNKERIRAITK